MSGEAFSGEMLVAAPERWDEACFAVPALRALLAAGMRVGVLCAEEQRDFWGTVSGLRVLPFPVRMKARALAAELAGRWKAGLAWFPGLAAESMTRAGIPRRLGPAGKDLRKFLTDPVVEPLLKGPPPHRVRAYLELVEALGPPTARPEFFAPAGLETHPESGSLLLCPGSDFGPSHEWPLERWGEIVILLRERGISFRVAFLPGGACAGRALQAGLAEGPPPLEADSFAGLFPHLAEFAVVLAADGSLPHLAAYAGARCVTLFGPNDPHWRRPLGKRHRVVCRHTECAPCLLPKCPLDLRCQQELETGKVWAALEEALGS